MTTTQTAPAGCRDCGGQGYRTLKAHEVGYVRRPDWDTADTIGYITPSECRVYHQRRHGDLELHQLCNCVRRHNGWALLAK